MQHRYVEHITALVDRIGLERMCNRLLDVLLSAQVDLLRYHRQDVQAIQLYAQLTALAKAPLSEVDLFARLLGLLRPPS